MCRWLWASFIYYVIWGIQTQKQLNPFYSFGEICKNLTDLSKIKYFVFKIEGSIKIFFLKMRNFKIFWIFPNLNFKISNNYFYNWMNDLTSFAKVCVAILFFARSIVIMLYPHSNQKTPFLIVSLQKIYTFFFNEDIKSI